MSSLRRDIDGASSGAPSRRIGGTWAIVPMPGRWPCKPLKPMFSEVYITHRTSMTKPFRRHLMASSRSRLRAVDCRVRHRSSNVTDTVFIGMADGWMCRKPMRLLFKRLRRRQTTCRSGRRVVSYRWSKRRQIPIWRISSILRNDSRSVWIPSLRFILRGTSVASTP